MTIETGLGSAARGPRWGTLLTRPWQQLCLATLRHMECGSLEASLPDGQQLSFQGSGAGPAGRITIHNPNFFRRLFTHGALGFGEMYLDGWWTTPTLDDLLAVFLLNSNSLASQFSGRRTFLFTERLRHLLKQNTRKGAKQNIAYHYDLGNDFYALWLDGTMTYSSARFADEGESLETAQSNKYESICRMLALAPGDRILEIGCGWGGFAEHAIRRHGARVTGITLSREQLEYARHRLANAGLAERAAILLRDYRDITGTFDKIVSIEMIEAVGEQYWPAYFATIRDCLRPAGTAVIQAITIDDCWFAGYRTDTDFIQKHIFPGGMLPCPDSIATETRRVGLQPGTVLAFPMSYDRTLRIWRRQFNAAWSSIAALGFNARFHRMWNYYLAGSAAGFRTGVTNVAQMAFHKPA